MIDKLLEYDRSLFRVINEGWSNSFFDWLMPWMRNSEMWYPLYIFLIVLVAVNYKKNALWWVIFAAGTVILSDFVSSKIIKENIIRLRPCNDVSCSDWIHVLVGYRPQSSSFTSSHAANHFSLAMFLYLTFKPHISKWGLLFFLWAFTIAFAQVYVGVHYPVDITCGALIGILIGYLTGKSFNRNYGLV
jgi:membrane-associated phospholipid phosphatase